MLIAQLIHSEADSFPAGFHPPAILVSYRADRQSSGTLPTTRPVPEVSPPIVQPCNAKLIHSQGDSFPAGFHPPAILEPSYRADHQSSGTLPTTRPVPEVSPSIVQPCNAKLIHSQGDSFPAGFHPPAILEPSYRADHQSSGTLPTTRPVPELWRPR